ncbi:5-formyltetrahydrofolate cyclo-ligase [Venturia nashicola]|uniref:5-formyltetrahydrofolate cyclo-ligase n=1 Tax=Venturia nashicola TaxID=86259 RepID=A0A4Z1PF38_9PEZI|nr:5-formyltetrahydrofolate cyclo-ligase [Venturia nashicola]
MSTTTRIAKRELRKQLKRALASIPNESVTHQRSKKTVPPNQLDQAVQPRQIMDMLELNDLQDYEGLELDAWGIPTPSEASLNERKNCFGGYGKSEDLDVEEADAEDELDLIITPGLGFDRNLGRTGRGMGFYDYFFQRCGKSQRRGKVPWKVGLALNEQVLPADQTVPMDETDQRIDALILGDGSVLRR